MRALLLDTTGDVEFRLAFSRDEEHRAVLHCEATAILKLRCQRCLGEFNHEVGTSTVLALASSIDEERRLPERYDPLLVSEIPLRPRDLIEDELLLALPQIPMHTLDVCTMQAQEMRVADEQPSGASPFAVLAELRPKG